MIAVFDSGVGGLSVLQEIERILPAEDVVYLGDTANVPYGTKAAEEITRLAIQATAFLLNAQPDIIVVACNTATSVAITTLRSRFPTVPIVGVVPVMKTLATQTITKRVAVCATSATLQSALYQKLKEDFCAGIVVLELARPEWVTFVESGQIDSPQLVASVASTLSEVQTFGADVMAFGCTHFSFLRSSIGSLTNGIRVLDSAPAVARHVARILGMVRRRSTKPRDRKEAFFSSGDPVLFSKTASLLLARQITAESVDMGS